MTGGGVPSGLVSGPLDFAVCETVAHSGGWGTVSTRRIGGFSITATEPFGHSTSTLST